MSRQNTFLPWPRPPGTSLAFLSTCHHAGRRDSAVPASLRMRLTCAVWSRARPRAVGQTLACGRAAEEVSLHAGIHDGVGESCSIQAGNTAVSGRVRVTTLHGCKGGREKRRGEGQRCKIVMDFLFSISVIHSLSAEGPPRWPRDDS